MRTRSILLMAISMSAIFLFAGVGHALAVLQAGMAFQGEVRSAKSGRTWPVSIRIDSVDERTGGFTGEMTWPNLGSVHRIEGKIAGHQITFKETQAIQKGQAHLNCEYAATYDNGLKGAWVEPDADNGTIRLTPKN